MFDFLGTFHGSISASIICVSVVFLIIFLSKKYNVEVDDGKVKLAVPAQADKKTTLPSIRYDDWKSFSTELYEFCIVLMQPEEKFFYAIHHCYVDDISQAKKLYVERFLYFNHLPAYGTRQYEEYVSAHCRAIILSVCRSIKFICGKYDQPIPEFEDEKIQASLSKLIEKYREKK